MAVPHGQTYQYTPLPSETASIRLLRILSGPEEAIECSLEVVDLGLKPQYDCLSYTWGDPLYHKLQSPQDIRETTDEREHPITCDGLIICVTDNLREALLQLSRNGHSAGGRCPYQKQDLIWIDAVCIDQGNLSERNHQVAMMNDIYSSAHTVVVWLGINDQHTDQALETIKSLASIPQEKHNVELPSDIEDPELYEALGIPYIEPQQWLDYAAFLQRTWFGRIWVIQETSVAKNIVVLCGSHVLLWSDITAGSQLLQATPLGDLLVTKVVEAINPFKSTSTYAGKFVTNQYIFEKIRQKATSLHLEKLLVYSRYFNATKAQDRVYALLGMWEQSLEHKKAHEVIRPDYNLPVDAVYTQASWATLRETADLNILSLVEDASQRKLPGLPSWVPDFSAYPRTHPLVDNLRPPTGSAARWNASLGLQFTVPIEPDDPRALPVEGLYIDAIADLAATETEVTDNHQLKSLLELLLRSLSSPRSSPYTDGTAGITTAFARTLIKDTFRGEPAGPDARNASPLLIAMQIWVLETAIENVRNALESAAAAEGGTSMPPTPLDPLPLELARLKDVYARTKAVFAGLESHGATDTHGWLPSWAEAQRIIDVGRGRVAGRSGDDGDDDGMDARYEAVAAAFRVAYTGRRVFRTRGGLWGLGPQSLERGDVVWVLAGVGVPVLLRGREGRCFGGRDGDGYGDGGVCVGESRGFAGGKDVKGGREEWRLVGEAYVHGIMNGEAVRGREGEVRRIWLV